MIMHHLRAGLVLKLPSWGFFSLELKETKAREFLTLKQDLLSVLEYGFKFFQLSHYALDMVKDIRSRMCLVVSKLGRSLSKEGKTAMLIG